MAKLSLFVGSGDLIVFGRGYSWMVAVKLWLVVGGGKDTMAGRGGRGWSWVMVAKLWLVMGGHE